jgi:hypothetical protein
VNLRLERLRALLRIAHAQRYIATGPYRHAAERIDEAGRMLGGWLRAEGRRPASGAPPREPEGP